MTEAAKGSHGGTWPWRVTPAWLPDRGHSSLTVSGCCVLLAARSGFSSSTQESKEQTNPTLSPKQLRVPAAQFHTPGVRPQQPPPPAPVSPDPQHSQRDGDSPRDTPRDAEGVKGSHHRALTVLPPWGQPEPPLPKNNHGFTASSETGSGVGIVARDRGARTWGLAKVMERLWLPSHWHRAAWSTDKSLTPIPVALSASHQCPGEREGAWGGTPSVE